MIRAVLVAACLVAAAGDSLQQGQSALKAGRNDEAVTAFSRVLASDPNSVAAYLGRGRAYLAEGRFAKSADDLYGVTVLDPKNPEARYLLAQADERQEKFQPALAGYKEALRLQPGYPGAQEGVDRVQQRAALADRIAKGEDKSLLAEAIAATPTNLGEAVDKYSQAIALNPDLTQAYVGRALIYERMGQFDKSIADWNRTLELAPRYAVAFMQRGNDYRAQKKYKEALADANRAVGLNPDAPEVFYNRAFVYFSMHDDDKAIADFSQAIKPDSAAIEAIRKAAPDTNEDTLGLVLTEKNKLRPNYYRGLLWFGKGAYAQAQADFEAALKSDPQSPSSLMCLARLHALQGEHDKEEDAYKRLEEMIKPHPEMANDIAWAMSISRIADLHDPPREVEIAKIACDGTNWKNFDFVDTYAAACADNGDFDSAVKWEQTYLDNAKAAPRIIEEARDRLKLYQQHKPYRADDVP